jgi:hypothetical protein
MVKLNFHKIHKIYLKSKNNKVQIVLKNYAIIFLLVKIFLLIILPSCSHNQKLINSLIFIIKHLISSYIRLHKWNLYSEKNIKWNNPTKKRHYPHFRKSTLCLLKNLIINKVSKMKNPQNLIYLYTGS